MRIDIVTIFPDYFGPIDADGQVGPSGPLGVSLIGKAGVRPRPHGSQPPVPGPGARSGYGRDQPGQAPGF